MICSLIFTHGRKECLERTLAHYQTAVLDHNQGIIGWTKIINDAHGDLGFRQWLDDTYGKHYEIYHNEGQLGFCGSIQRAWSLVPDDATFIWHQEDDFIYQRPPDFKKFTACLEQYPYLVQLVMKRQPWSPEEKEAGGICEMWPDEYVEVEEKFVPITWTEHSLFWSTNPCIYSTELTKKFSWPDGPRCEEEFTKKLLKANPGYRFAFVGGKFDPPAVIHIGESRTTGTGY